LQIDKAGLLERERCHLCQIRSFATHSKIPISIVNETDDGATLNPNFRFIDHSIIANDVRLADQMFRTGCECADDEDCMYSTCHCLDEMAPDSDEGDDGGNRPRKKRIAYHTQGNQAGLLRTRILESKEPIYECHEGCACSLQCPNRVVERGRTMPLQIFRTENRGWGVKCALAIPKGRFVDRYLGEIITKEEADRRRENANIAQRKDVYLFALDKFSDPNSPDPFLSGPPLEVDGEFMSGPTRFINHSCDPNMAIFAVVGDHTDKHIHDLALFAIKEIDKGQELTFDYVAGNETPTDPSDIKDMTKCLCGSEKCRGFLW